MCLSHVQVVSVTHLDENFSLSHVVAVTLSRMGKVNKPFSLGFFLAQLLVCPVIEPCY